MTALPTESIRAQLEKLMSSNTFAGAARSRQLLRFLVEETLSGRGERLKEYTIGAEALGRGDTFDPRADPIVRAEASRLRSRLDAYYAAEGQHDAVAIAIPKGGYVPLFESRVVTVSAGEPRHWGRWATVAQNAAWVVIGVLVTAAAMSMWRSTDRGTSRAEAPVIRLDADLQSGEPLGSEVGTDVAVSPDGTRLVFVSYGHDGSPHLNTRRLDQSTVTPLPETVGARGPFFSPDSQWVAFWAGGKLKKTPVNGGSPVVLCDATDLLGGTWTDDGAIIAVLNSTPRLWRVPSSGGSPTPVMDLSAESTAPRWPRAVPGTDAVLFTAIGAFGPDGGEIQVLSLRSGRKKTLVRGGTFGRYVPTGHLVYVNQGTLYAVGVDVASWETRGQPVPVLDDLAYSQRFGFGQFDISDTGILVYRRTARSGQYRLQWIRATGSAEDLPIEPGRYQWPRISPDDRRLALTVAEGGAESLWLYDRGTTRMTQVTVGNGSHTAPLWTRSGRFLLAQGSGGIEWMRPDAETKALLLVPWKDIAVPWTFTPDGKRLAFYAMDSKTGFDLWTVPIEETADGLRAGQPEPFLRTRSYEVYPSYSPDGRWIAYSTNETGNWNVFVRAFPDNGTVVQISRTGGRVPIWSKNGRELLFSTDDQQIMAVSYHVTSGAFVGSEPRRWTTTKPADTGVLPNFDTSASDGRILALMSTATPQEQQSRNHVTFVLNFPEEIRRRTQ